jgi:tetratricopeptide (TPR) repeat protein
LPATPDTQEKKPPLPSNINARQKLMKSLKNFFILLLLLAIKQSLQAQYEHIFKTPFPRQTTVLDSALIMLAKVDSATLYSGIEKIKEAAANVDEYTRLNLDRAILSVKTDVGYELESAVANGEKIIERSMKLQAPEMAAAQYMTLGYYYEMKTQSFGKAFENYLKAFELFERISLEKIPNKRYLQYMVSLSYYHYGDYENSLKLALRTDKTVTEKNYVYVFNANLIGMCYLRMNKYDSARNYFQQVFANAKAMTTPSAWQGIALGNIGNTYFFQNNFQKAISYLAQAIPLTVEGKVFDNTVGFASRLSDIFQRQQNLREAKKFLDIALSSARINGDNDSYATVHSTAASYYRVTNNPTLSLLHIDSAALFNSKLTAQKDLNTKYKIEMAVEKEKVKEREKMFANEKERQLFLRNAIIGSVVLLMIISVLLYNRSQLKNKSRQQQLIAEKKLAENELQTAAVQLNAFTQSIREKNEFIEKATQEIERVNAELNLAKDKQANLAITGETDNNSLRLLQNSVILTDEDWKNFTALFEKVYQNFLFVLRKRSPAFLPLKPDLPHSPGSGSLIKKWRTCLG